MFDQFTRLVSDASGWAYAIIFLLALLDALVPVVPSESSVITAGVVASRGDLSVSLVVVAAAVGGLPVAVDDGVSGVLVPGHDPRDYARVLARFADDPGLGVRMGREAARHARSFGWEGAATATAEVYASALQEHRRLRSHHG